MKDMKKEESRISLVYMLIREINCGSMGGINEEK